MDEFIARFLEASVAPKRDTEEAAEGGLVGREEGKTGIAAEVPAAQQAGIDAEVSGTEVSSAGQTRLCVPLRGSKLYL